MRWLGLVVLTVFLIGGNGKKFRSTGEEDYSKIMEEYLLRTFDGGSRGGDKKVEEESITSDVGRADEVVIVEEDGVNGEESESDSEGSTIEIVESPIEDEDEESEEEESGSGSGEEESGSGSGEEESEGGEDESGSEEEESGSGEEESGSGVEESTILNSAPYSMDSNDGATSVNIILQQVSSSDLLNMVCQVSTDNSDLFEDSECVPQIYMVTGVSSCSSFPDEISAKKLADVHGAGNAEVVVDATWSELPGKCLVMLKPTTCGEDGSGSDNVEVLDIGEEEGSGNSEVEENTNDITSERRSLRDAGILRSAGFGRSYGTISLSRFTLLSSGSSSVFTVSVPSSVPIFGGVISGIVSTPYNKFSTLPYLQLPGWTATDAILIAMSMLVAYYVYAYNTASPVSLLPFQRKVFNEAQIARVDSLHGGLSAIAETYLLSLSNPWKNILGNIDRNLLKFKEGNHEYVSKNKLVKKRGRPFNSSPKLANRSGWFSEKEGWRQTWKEEKNSERHGAWKKEE